MLLTRLIWLGLLPAGFYLYCQINYPQQPAARLAHYVIQLFFLFFATLSLARAAFRADEMGRSQGAVPNEEWTVETKGSNTRIWGFLAAGATVWTFTAILELLEIFLQQPNYGTMADAFWITGYLAVLAGTRHAASSVRSGTNQARRIGITWLAFSGTIVLLGSLFVGPYADSSVIFLLALTYNIADILLTYWAIVATLNATTEKDRIAMKYLLIAFFVMYAGNLIVILQVFTGPLHQWSAAAFSVSYLFLFAAGRVFTQRSSSN